jgi:organic hydroperoxide reductase OsmC/OhrA
MSEYRVTVAWSGAASPAEFVKGRYSREHHWTFDGGLVVAASSSPSVVRTPWSNPANVDPEEAYVASISSCHMLTFLYLAAKAGFAISQYSDQAVGTMAKTTEGASWIDRVTLSPQIRWAGDHQPSPEQLAQLHHAAHRDCFIANSVKTEISVV